MPVPAFANSVVDKNVLLSQLGLTEVLQLARKASLLIVGIGEVQTTGFLAASGMIRPNELAELKRVGGCGEILGHFFAPDGSAVETELTARALSLDVKDLPKSQKAIDVPTIISDVRDRVAMRASTNAKLDR